MDCNIPKERLEAARKALASTLRKTEKAHATLLAKNAAPGHIRRTARSIADHRTMLSLVQNALQPGSCAVPDDAQLESARSAAAEYGSRVEAVMPKFPAGTPQHTLALRRIDAYRLAGELIAEKQGGDRSDP